jgi:hypothetical protein
MVECNRVDRPFLEGNVKKLMMMTSEKLLIEVLFAL